MYFSTLFSLAASIAIVSAQVKGFNTGSTFTDGSAKAQADFESEFAAQKALAGTSGFTSARLYTCIQGGTTNTPISAIPAAIAQDTTLLLGLWASAGQSDYTNEIAALTSAISQYGTAFTSRVLGISVGSEDLYRTSTTGIAAMAGVGTTPDVIVSYINQLRSALKNTALSGAKITHVDTYNAWTNGSNSAVISAVDFISMDVYPYFQSTMANSIEQGAALFNTAYQETIAAAQGKDVWVTETGWPVSGANQGQAVASVANAKTYWDAVGCNILFGKVNTFWYILQDALPTTPSPSFGLVGAGSVTAAPLFNLTCPAIVASSSTAAMTSTTAASSSTAVGGGSGGLVGAGSNSAATSSSSSSAVAQRSASPSSSAAGGAGGRAGFTNVSSASSRATAVASSSHTSGSSTAAANRSSTTAAAGGATTSRTSSSSTSAATTSSSNVSTSSAMTNMVPLGAATLALAALFAALL